MLKGILQLVLAGTVFSFSSLTSATLLQCKTADVTWNGSSSDACAGAFAGNDGNLSNVPNSDPWAGGTFTLLTKSDSDDEDEGSSIGGVEFEIAASGSGTDGTWTLSWSSVSSSSFPISLDLIASVKGATQYSFYLFEDLTFNANPDFGIGTFSTISLLNNGGNTPGLSHMSIFGREVVVPPVVVSEPGTAALFSLALIGLVAARRRTRLAK